jgi:hypothetical protein
VACCTVASGIQLHKLSDAALVAHVYGIRIKLHVNDAASSHMHPVKAEAGRVACIGLLLPVAFAAAGMTASPSGTPLAKWNTSETQAWLVHAQRCWIEGFIVPSEFSQGFVVRMVPSSSGDDPDMYVYDYTIIGTCPPQTGFHNVHGAGITEDVIVRNTSFQVGQV